jgi:hypothetical protein
MTNSLIEPQATRAWSQPWLSSARFDCSLILAPAFITALIALAFKGHLENSDNLPLWAWVGLVLLIDVAHVYATLFRTYLDKNAFAKNKTLLLVVPAACWIAGSLLYAIDGLLFWQCLAYLAVFHFIRQQFGFVVLYSKGDPPELRKFKWLDSLCVYAATVYPLLYWHAHLPRNFNWFVSGDFVECVPAFMVEIGLAVYLAVLVLYLAKESVVFARCGFLNLPRNLLIAGTALSWWVGIVALNSDLAFTMTNVVSHGIPYMALIWLYHHRSAALPENEVSGGVFKRKLSLLKDFAIAYVPAFLLFLAALAYLEEGLWDGLIWREHLSFFPLFTHLPSISDPALLAILIPLLSLPQSTHYVLDGFIWRVKDRTSSWSA